jgi:hypothetical protein
VIGVLAELHAVPVVSGAVTQLYTAAVGGNDIALAAVIFGTISGLFYPLVRAIARRMERGGTPTALPLQNVEERLDRIERAVEAIAVEVERVSEGQRFVTKLLADKAPAKLPGQGE